MWSIRATKTCRTVPTDRCISVAAFVFRRNVASNTFSVRVRGILRAVRIRLRIVSKIHRLFEDS
jgi:hypothetical protein